MILLAIPGGGAEFEGQRIAQIRFEPASQPLTEQQIARALPMKSGEPLRGPDVRSAIKRLYATGRYENIAVDVEPGPGGVNLIFRTSNRWFVGPVEARVKGKFPPTQGQLANAARLQLGQPVGEQDLKSAVEGIQDMLKRNGYFQATVEPKVTREPKYQQESVTFQIKTGKRARFEQPEVTGDTRIPPEKVAKSAKYKGWFRWKLDTSENMQTGLRNIRQKYAKEDRLTASVTLQDTEYDAERNRAKPIIEANGGPKVKLDAVGAKVSKGKMKKYVPVYDEGTVNRDLLVLGARNLRDYFQSIGYFDVDIDFQTHDAGPDEREITYVINTGDRHKLVSVDVTGNKYFLTDDLRERMFLQPAGFIRLRHGRYSEGFVRRDEDAIKALYHANGFRDVKITTRTSDDYKGKTGDVAVTMTIDEGPQYFVSDFNITGMQFFKIDDLFPRLSSATGQPFSETSVALDRDYILDLYQSNGFPDATFDYRTQPDSDPHRIKVEYVITEGKQRFVRDVLLTGIRTTRPRLVSPNILLQSGDPLSWTEMGRMQRRLYNLGVFDKVDMAIQNPDGDTDRKYVLYHLEEGHKYSVAVGLGAEVAKIGGNQNTLDNPAGQTGFSPRGSLEVSRLNLWGLGHSLNFKSRYSTLDKRASLNYLAPRYRNVDGRNISVTALYDKARDVRTFTARRLEGSIQYSQLLSKPTTLLLRYTYRDVRVDPGTLKISPLLIPILSQPARIGMIAASLVQDRRDDPTNAHRGIYNTIDVGVANRGFASRRNFFRALARDSWYHSLRNDVVFAMNTEFGWIAPFGVPGGTDPAQYIPLPERFFGGGSTSHRGFPDNQAGPRDPETGFPLGGNALLFHSTELRFPLIGDNINGVLFHDLGNIYSSISNISFRFSQKDVNDFDYMVHAVGFGVRYRTPIGPIRLDLAYSINPPSFYGLKGTIQQLVFGGATRTLQNVSHFQFFFSIGQAF